MPEDRFYKLTAEESAGILKTDLTSGLTSAEAADRIAKYGLNSLKENVLTPPLKIFLDQFKDFIIWVLIGASLVSGFLKEWIDALAIIAIVVLNAILGFIQEYHAEKSLAALKKLSSPASKVIRDGKGRMIPSSEIVPGDLIELEAGDNVPADARLIYATNNFTAQEASLTGESVPVAKTIHPLAAEKTALADRANMAYAGTAIAAGKARAIVAATGMNTELGRIAGMIQEIGTEKTPLQKKLEEFGKWVVYLCFVLVALVFIMGLIRGGKIIDLFLTSVSLAVAAIPEGLPAVVTIALALGVQRMVKRNVIIRKLSSVETLGSASVICSDKTGTLTKNEMTVQALYAGSELFKISGIGYEPRGEFLLHGETVDPAKYPDIRKTLAACVLCNGASLIKEGQSYKIAGDPTEGALLTVAAKAGIFKKELENKYRFIEEIPFDSDRKKMTVVRRYENKLIAFVKGAPETIIADCVNIEESGRVRQLSDGDREKILRTNTGLANQAMRVLAVSYKDLEDPGTPKGDAVPQESSLTFLGLIAMIDPPRDEVREAVKECKSAGIRTVMITGDHKSTAVAVAVKLGFFTEGSIALSGEELDGLNDEDFSKMIANIPVYARVSPEHKLRIVRMWREVGGVVAMTGDGVNDAPAVKEADIGVAMGITGTDVTKEVSKMVITDDNFASIVAAVEEGRGIYDNIKKFIHYLLSCNAGEILVMFIASLAGLPVPLLPVQILWVNLVTDGLPALALGVDPLDPEVMKRPPRPASEPVVTGRRAVVMLSQGALIAFLSLLAFWIVLYVEKEGIALARSACFIVLSCTQLFHAFNCRSMTESIFKIGIFTNIKLLYANYLKNITSLSYP